ncbi:GNAT family N-acetyltransferase [Priestia aryabhattai]|uniref:GNAT family N-acetyltransferase n=1 Tax=Priestia aryabhattai TaxID=412384 RepID=UPI003D2C80E6
MEELYFISSDKSLLDLDVIHKFLTYDSYWAQGITKKTVATSIINSALCFGIYKKNSNKGIGEQVGFARVISDLSTFAYIADVFVLEKHRGKGLSKKLINEIMVHPDLITLRRVMLATKDAQGLYSKFGFKELNNNPNLFMELKRTL